MVSELNRILKKYDIITTERIRHFLAQCMQETNKGLWLREGEYLLDNPYNYTQQQYEDYYNNTKYKYKYRGAGFIQITWEYGYQAFATFMIKQTFPNLDITWKYPNNTGADKIEELYEEAIINAELNQCNIDKYKKLSQMGLIMLQKNLLGKLLDMIGQQKILII